MSDTRKEEPLKLVNKTLLVFVPLQFSGPEVTWVDGQKPIFTVNFQLISTVLTKDPHLHNLFVHAERLLDLKMARACPSDTETCQILKVCNVCLFVNNQQ